jgi:hypothetical protein
MKPNINKHNITNPLDELFNTPPHQENEVDEYANITEGELANMANPEEPPEKDEEDIAIDEKIDNVYDAAINAFNTQTAYTEIIEPRYAARNAEVAANYLAIALNAANSRAKVKGDRKRNNTFVPYANNKNPAGVVVASREEILRMISVDAEVKEFK